MHLAAVPRVCHVHKVFFGAQVTLLNLDDNSELEIKLLGADEIDPASNIISIDSPMAKVIMGKRIDDDVSLTIEGREFNYSIDGISYH